MSLLTPALDLAITEDEATIITRPIAGSGGHQGLLRNVLVGYDKAKRRLTIEDVTLQKVYDHAYIYGKGGYQDRFRAIMRAASRAGWQP